MKCCENCKHVHEPYDNSICRSCDITDASVSLGKATHSKWEPKDPGTAFTEFIENANKEEKKMSKSLIQDDSVNKKTTSQLTEELKMKNDEIAELKKELKKSEEHDSYVELGRQARQVIDGMMEGGLTREEAFELFKLTIGSQLNNPLNALFGSSRRK